MSKNHDFFSLIATLEKNERKHITQFGKAFKQKPRYMLLFELLCKEIPSGTKEPVSEDDFRAKYQKQFEGSYRNSKNTLKTRITDALRNNSGEFESLDAGIRRNLHNAEIMFGRGLESLGDSYLREAEKEAREGEKLELLLSILKLKRDRVVFTQPGDYKKQVQDTYLEIRKLLEQMLLRQNYLEMKDRFFTQAREQPLAKDPDTLTRLEKWITDPLLADESRAKGFDAKHYFFYSHALYHQLTGNLSRSRDFLLKDIRHWQNYPKIQKDRTGHFSNLVYLFLQVNEELDEFEEISPILDQTESLKVQSLQEGNNKQLNLWMNLLQYHIRKGETEKAHQILKKYREFESAGTVDLIKSRNFAYWMLFSVLGFIQGDFALCTEWNNRILKHRAPADRKDIYLWAYLLKAILQWETEGEAGTSLRAFNDQLKEVRQDGKWLGKTRDLIRQLERADSGTEKSIFAIFIREFDSLSAVRAESNSPGFWLVSRWVRARANGKPLLELIRAENQK